MVRIAMIINYLEQIAPMVYQEDYDNSGLVIGDATKEVTGILICLDITEAVLHEAIAKNCNLIIAHHPLIFHPIKKLTGKNYVEKCIIQAIKQELAIYTIHTNLDNIAQGVNSTLAERLGLKNTSILLLKKATLHKLTTFVPQEKVNQVRKALHQAGAGCVGNYTDCSFVTTGMGSFKPAKATQPYIGTPGKFEEVAEHRLEVTFPIHLEKPILKALKATHPYEEAVYYIQKIENRHPDIGTGMVGTLETALSSKSFLTYLKTQLALSYVRHTAYTEKPIQKVAICGGAGIFLLQEACMQQVDALITADLTYHDFFNANGKMLIADIGHYDSEVGTKALIHTLLSKKFGSIALIECETVTNPVHYS